MQHKARMTIRFEPPKPTQPMKPLNHPQLIAKPSLTKEYVKPEISIVVQDQMEQDEFAQAHVEQAHVEQAHVEQVHVEQGTWDSSLIKHEYTVWNSPPQDDIHALEEMIRTSSFSVDPNVNHSSQLPTEQIGILLDKPLNGGYSAFLVDQVEENLLSAQNREVTRLSRIHAENEQLPSGWRTQPSSTYGGPSWTRVFLSVTSAVATGALFGYLVLGLFTGDPLFPGKTDDGTEAPAIASLGNSEISQALPSNVTVGSQSIQQLGGEADLMLLPTEVYYMLQYGVFQNEESMQVAVKQVQELGLESTVERKDGYRVYIGISLTRDTAELLAAQLSNMELYIKPVELASVTLPSVSLPEGGTAFMNTTAEYIRKLAQYSSYYLQDQLPVSMQAADSSALAEAHKQWLSKTSIAAMLSKDIQDEGNNIIQVLNSAALSMTEYNREPSRFHLWSVQSNTMKAMLSFRNLREELLSAGIEK